MFSHIQRCKCFLSFHPRFSFLFFFSFLFERKLLEDELQQNAGINQERHGLQKKGPEGCKGKPQDVAELESNVFSLEQGMADSKGKSSS